MVLNKRKEGGRTKINRALRGDHRLETTLRRPYRPRHTRSHARAQAPPSNTEERIKPAFPRLLPRFSRRSRPFPRDLSTPGLGRQTRLPLGGTLHRFKRYNTKHKIRNKHESDSRQSQIRLGDETSARLSFPVLTPCLIVQ